MKILKLSMFEMLFHTIINIVHVCYIKLNIIHMKNFLIKHYIFTWIFQFLKRVRKNNVTIHSNIPAKIDILIRQWWLIKEVVQHSRTCTDWSFWWYIILTNIETKMNYEAMKIINFWTRKYHSNNKYLILKPIKKSSEQAQSEKV